MLYSNCNYQNKKMGILIFFGQIPLKNKKYSFIKHELKKKCF